MDFTDTFYGRPSTITTYKSLFKQHIQSLLMDSIDWKNWSEASTYLILDSWNKQKLSKNTKITLIRLLRKYVKFNGGPEINTKYFIKSLERSEQQKEVKTLTSEQASNLMNTTKRLEPKFYPVMLLALHAGLRRGEIFGLRCGDIDMINGKIKISHSYDGPTKNGKSRIVPIMSNELSNELIKARNLLLRNPDEKVFEQFDPNPILRRLCDHAKIPILRFHDLRHTFASIALSNQINIKKVSVWLGHSSVTTTLDIYWHLTKNEPDIDFLPKCK